MQRQPRIDISQADAPGLLRRLAAVLYDSLLICALLIFLHMLVVIGLMWLGGFDPALLAGNPFYIAFWCAVPALFFVWFWSHGGQTLGMRVWRIKVVTVDGDSLGLAAGMRRFAAALLSWAALGLGFLWVLVDRHKLAWHDRLSGTRLVVTRPVRNR